MIEIELANQQKAFPVDESRLVAAVQRVLSGEGIRRGTISLAVVDDPTIHQLNRRYLQHDEATDVLSFVLERRGDTLEGEVVVSADTADSCCGRFGWTRDDELLLYAVHGALHLAGYDDQSPEDRQRMRERERHYLAGWGLEARYDETGTGDSADAGRPAGPGEAAE
jgi:probable rRNA maturation factor